MAESYLKTRDYERLLTYPQQKKYSAAIKQGFFNNYHGTEWRHTFYGAYIWKYPKRTSIISRFERMLGRLPEWSDITDDNLRDFKSLLEETLSPNSVKVIGAEIIALINENKPTKKIASETFSKVMKKKNVPVSSVYLTEDEINAIHRYIPDSTYAKTVKRLFMIECLTGARFSDCLNMSTENIVIQGHNKLLRYVSTKSNIEVTLPVDRRLPQYLVPCVGEAKEIANSPYNRVLRRICRNCGIDNYMKIHHGGKDVSGKKWELVSSHTGRRSFATNLSLKGVAIEQIAMMMGHMNGNVPNVNTTRRYIVGKMKLDFGIIKMFGAYIPDEEEKEEALLD